MSLKNLNVSKKTHKFLLDKLKDKRTFQIYQQFEAQLDINTNFIVAVSGGPDSLALSFLAKIYSIKNSLEVKYFIVDHKLAGSAQYWYAETFRIRQLYTDAASAYLEGYQKYPKGNKAPINLLKLGVSMVQIGEKDQGCKMINGVELQYPKANQSVIQKAKYESKKFECIKEDS